MPELSNTAFNSPTLLGIDNKTIKYIALINSAQDQILKVASHKNSINKNKSYNNKA